MDVGVWLAVDLVLALLLVGLGWAAVSSSDLQRGVVLFIAFGLLLALVWARLRAPDLALAEAAIGAGLSGALLLAGLRDEPVPEEGSDFVSGPLAWAVSLLTLVLGVVVAWALLEGIADGDPIRLADQVYAQLPHSGVSNPVTAVLLNFRAYDTLLELAVLLSAVLGVMALGPARPGFRPAGQMLGGLVTWLVPLLIITAGYLLWVGAHAPGGAFQAGALLAGAAVLLRLVGFNGAGLPRPAMQRGLLAGGVGVFLAVGLLVTAGGAAFLQYPQGADGALILLIESAATLAIGCTLALIYIGGRPPGWENGATPPTSKMNREAR